MDIQKISTQQAIEEALEEIKVSTGHRYDYYMGKIESNAVEWLTHQQSILSQQSKEIEQLHEIHDNYVNHDIEVTNHRLEEIGNMRKYIGFLQSCTRSGETWEGTIDDFITKVGAES